MQSVLVHIIIIVVSIYRYKSFDIDYYCNIKYYSQAGKMPLIIMARIGVHSYSSSVHGR